MHRTLDSVGLVCDACDLVHAGIYLLEGNQEEAAYSLAAMIPVVGIFGKFFKRTDAASNIAKGYTTSSLSNGREIHKLYKLDEANPARGMHKEYNGVRGVRPDFVDMNTRTIFELKPNNPRSIKQGWNQLAKYKMIYEQELGGSWKIVLDVY